MRIRSALTLEPTVILITINEQPAYALPYKGSDAGCSYVG